MKKRFFLFTIAVAAAVFALLTSARNAPVNIFMIGDSTMANKPLEKQNQERGWGQALASLLDKDKYVVDNHAMNGRSTKSFIDEGRWDAVMAKLHEGDVVVIQFGHNDEKDDEKRHTDAQTSFRDNLTRFVTDARSKGAHPILMNSIVRRKFSADGSLEDTHGEYATVPREVAVQLGVPFVDANAISHSIVEGMGDRRSTKLFMWVEPGKYEFCPDGKKDDTHLNISGARKMAKTLWKEMRKVEPRLK